MTPCGEADAILVVMSVAILLMLAGFFYTPVFIAGALIGTASLIAAFHYSQQWI